MTESAVDRAGGRVARRGSALCAAVVVLACRSGVTLGQTRPAVTVPTTVQAETRIDFNFPEAVELRTLVDYVSRRLGSNIVYDAELADPKNVVTIRSPRGLPPDALLPLLRSVLRMKGFSLVEGEDPGWSRIVKADSAKVADVATTQPAVQFLTLKHAAANRVAQQVKQLVSSARQRGGADAPAFDVIYDDRTNQIGAMGATDAVADAIRIAESIDVDVPNEAAPIRFYKLTNATAADVLDTIRELQGKPRLGGGKGDAAARAASTDGVAPRAESAYSSGNTPTLTSPMSGGTRGLTAAPALTPAGGSLGAGDAARTTPASVGASNASAAEASALSGGDLPGVTADANTNTIIVMGGPEVQNRYSQLIAQLDKRRPQVLLEATIVTLDTTNQFRFGVELAGHSNGNGGRVLTFSQFGLSTVDANTGRLSLSPGLGFNGAIVGSDVADVIIQALQANSRTRVQSAPRVLVNDNATGTLSAVAEQPFTSVNASDTIATTSFGGYAEAGTTIALTPHISEDDYLQLEYSVELSSFTGNGDTRTGSPPPRQTNKIDSKVTIPDGSTIIVGGLNRSNYTRATKTIPILGDIPILGALFGNRQNDDSTSTLFVFLRPIILRDDQFKDLKNLSERDTKSAGIPGDFPQSDTLLIRR